MGEEETGLLETAMGIISNVGLHKDGWSGQGEEWCSAARRWLDDYGAWVREYCETK